MSEDQVHAVFGAGQVGRALITRLVGLDLPVRVLSRHRPAGLADVIDWRETDAADPEAATEAATGASVIYQCLNAPAGALPPTATGGAGRR